MNLEEEARESLGGYYPRLWTDDERWAYLQGHMDAAKKYREPSPDREEERRQRFIDSYMATVAARIGVQEGFGDWIAVADMAWNALKAAGSKDSA